MTAVGKMIDAEQQLCYAHGVQLAVLDVLYKRCSAPQPIDADIDTINSAVGHNNDDESDGDNDIDGGELGLDILDDGNYDLADELSGEYHEVVNKVRKVVKIFRRSPTKK